MVSVALPAARQRISVDRAGWGICLWLVLELVAVSFTLIGLLDGASWWFALVGTGVVVFVVDAALRMIGVPRWLAPVGGVLTTAAILTAQFGGGTGIAGVVPTPATFAQFGDLVGQAAHSVAQQSTPASAVPELVFLVAAGGGIFAVVADACATALRMPALTAVPIAAVLVVPSAFLITGISPLALTSAAITYVGLLRADVLARRGAAREAGLALSIAASAIVLALLVSTTAPGFQQIGRQGISAGGLTIGTGVNPLIDLGQDLRRPAGIVVMHYTTTSPNPPYLRLASLDSYSGTTWRHTASKTTPLGAGGDVPMAPGLGSDVATDTVTTQVQISNVQSDWLPVPYAPAKITGLGGDWGWESIDRTIAAASGGTGGASYTARSKLIEPTAAQLRASKSAYPADVQKDLFVPFSAPAVIRKTALAVTAGSTSDYDKAVALQNYFHNGTFTYSLDAPVRKGYDGDSMDVIATFLKVKAGYCVHFASAMAVMARTLGIPARIAMGYLPGTFTGSASNGRAGYTVSSDDLHAWPELYFSGVGWVAFEPTVSRGTQPSYTVPGYVAPPPVQSGVASSAPTTAASVPTASATQPGGAATATSASLTPILSTGGVLLFFLLILVAPSMVRRWRRTTRFRRLSDDWGSSVLAWTEVVDTARDLGMAVPETQTPRAFADRLRDGWDDIDAVEALEALLAATERERFGRPGAVAYDPSRAADLRVVLDRMLADVGAAVRLRAALVPVSLLPRFASPVRSSVRFSA
jgi:Transglutaminase-like enzymes, putative cysteine proteases